MNVVRSDVLVIGGGIAGCFAAIKAREEGRSVAILDKATLRRGGSVGPGMDHVSLGVHPQAITYEEARAYAAKARKDLQDPNVTLAIDVHAYERVQDMERFGIPVREDDGSYFVWNDPERHFSCVSYRGVDTKVKLGQAVERSGADIYERTMGVELLKGEDGRVTGAVGLNTRTGALTVFLSKATIICTGETTRQYIAPDGPFNTYFSPTNTGDAGVMAYRAGAKLVNMEFLYWDYVIVRAGGGIVGVKPTKFMGKLVNRNGDVVLNTLEENINRCFIMQKEIIEGRGPLYWDLRDVPEEALKIYEREMSNEYPITKQWFQQRGIDIRRDLIPMKLDPCCIVGGPVVDERLRTSVPGLYAAGATTPYSRAIVGASVSGHIAGENAARYAASAPEPQLPRHLEELELRITAPLHREEGISPKELELSVRGLISEYVGYFKSEDMMQYALDKLLELKKAYAGRMTAHNPHELMRCCEVESIITFAEMHIRASMYRKETRYRHLANFVHYRSDYPDTDPQWEKWVVVQKGEEGEMTLSTAEVPELEEA